MSSWTQYRRLCLALALFELVTAVWPRGTSLAQPSASCARRVHLAGRTYDFVNDCSYIVYWIVQCKAAEHNCFGANVFVLLEPHSHAVKELPAIGSFEYRGPYKRD
jgi:hypothetical protein